MHTRGRCHPDTAAQRQQARRRVLVRSGRRNARQLREGEEGRTLYGIEVGC